MITKEFLETYPLYRKLGIDEQSYLCWMNHIPSPAINMQCSVCKSIQTYNMINEYKDLIDNQIQSIWGRVVVAIYECSSCNKDRYYFFLEFVKTKTKTRSGASRELGFVRKIGQTPPWAIIPEKNLEEMLSEHADYFKKGLVCESQGYGIGAFAYFRRITEEIIDDLLSQIEILIPEEDKEKYVSALEKTKTTRVAEEKIELVKDLLPETLKPNGINPLDVLHSTLSEGLHSENDEMCLEHADKIKKCLVFLVNRILKQRNEDKEFTDGLRELLDRKSKKIAEKKKETK